MTCRWLVKGDKPSHLYTTRLSPVRGVTPPKTHMEPENAHLEKEKPFTIHQSILVLIRLLGGSSHLASG